MAVDNPDRGGL